jgi:hypothetical protein
MNDFSCYVEVTASREGRKAKRAFPTLSDEMRTGASAHEVHDVDRKPKNRANGSQ